MITLASGLSYFDLDFMQLPRIIATAVVHGPGGVALIDPGPTSTLPRLRSTLASAGIAMRDVTTVLLTHIHLDHAGAMAWATTCGAVGYLLGYSWETIEKWIGHLGLVFLIVLAAAGVVALVRAQRRPR